MDRIIFPNGKQEIFSITFPNGETIKDLELLECSMCEAQFLAGKLFDQHREWEKTFPNCIYEPTSRDDFLHRQCPMCGKKGRIHKAKDKSGGITMPNADEVMKLYLSGDEVIEMSKAGPLVATIVGQGEIVEYKKQVDGKEKIDRRIQICVELPGEEQRFWSPNQTSMRAIIAKYGSSTEAWEGKSIKLKAVEQNVSGTFKKVVYGEPTQ
jgi:hypothetical protein